MSDETPETNQFREQASAIVAAVLGEKPADAAKTFASAMSDSTYEIVNDLRDQVNANMYQPQVEESIIVVDEEGQEWEMDLSLAEEILGESEEVTAFLESIEGDELSEEQEEQLNELSSKLLGRYIAKASTDVATRQAQVQANKAASTAFWNATYSMGRGAFGHNDRNHYDHVNKVSSAGRAARDAIDAIDTHTRHLEKKISFSRHSRPSGIEMAQNKLDHSSAWTRVKASTGPKQLHGPNKPSNDILKSRKKDKDVEIRRAVQPSGTK